MLWQRLTPLYETGEAKAIVQMVLEDCFGMTMADYLCGKVDALSHEQRNELEGMMRRLEQGEPVQYVTGQVVFCGRTFHVESGVLIPRPETEGLVRWLIESREANAWHEHILDIGTGSGCIAVSIACGLRNACVEAWDISEDALRVAKGNAESLGAHVMFRRRDILTLSDAPHERDCTVSPLPKAADSEPYTAIISNPPYICLRERGQMMRNVLDYEPDVALFVPDDKPLLFYNAIADYASMSLAKGGSLFFEINPLYSSDVEQMLMQKGFFRVEVRYDEYGKKRMIRAQKK